MRKFEKLHSKLTESDNFVDIRCAYLDGYPCVTFTDTDLDIGLAVHADKDYFEVIYNFNNKKRFTNIEEALAFARMKGHEKYSVYDEKMDSRAHYALEDFLQKAYSYINTKDTVNM
jgi:hypothetical protein